MARSKQEWTCEASVGVEYSGIAPIVILCCKPAKLYGWAALCDEHKHILKKASSERLKK